MLLFLQVKEGEDNFLVIFVFLLSPPSLGLCLGASLLCPDVVNFNSGKSRLRGFICCGYWVVNSVL